MLSRSGKNGNSCLVLDHREQGFRLSPLNMMLAMGFSYMAFIVIRKFPSVCNLLIFNPYPRMICLLILEREEGKQREGREGESEKHQC